MHETQCSNLTTGNKHYSSTVLQSNQISFVFTAPYDNEESQREGSTFPHPQYDQGMAHAFIKKHGLAVRAIGIQVGDAREAFEKSVENGAVGVCPPTELVDTASGNTMVVSEIKSVDDVVLRFVSGDFEGPFLPNMTPVNTPDINYGLTRMDHIVTNVPVLFDAVDYLIGAAGLHEFAEFTADDVGTVDSGLNSMVLANNSETVLMPFNEPTHGTKRQSQIQTYLDHNNGSGVQHIALKTDDIFRTMRELRQRSLCGGFEFMPAPNQFYYDNVPARIGEDTLTADQLKELQELGLLADRDDQGVLLQVGGCAAALCMCCLTVGGGGCALCMCCLTVCVCVYRCSRSPSEIAPLCSLRSFSALAVTVMSTTNQWSRLRGVEASGREISQSCSNQLRSTKSKWKRVRRRPLREGLGCAENVTLCVGVSLGPA